MIDLSKPIATRIKQLMLDIPGVRDNDLRLIANMWAQEVDLDKTSARDFLKLFASGAITSPESIRRIRQMLQETIPELRGQRWLERQARHEESIREQIKEARTVIEVKKEMAIQKPAQEGLFGE